jgi:hypothetical protein
VHTYRKCGRVDNQVVQTRAIFIIIVIIFVIIIIANINRTTCVVHTAIDPTPHFLALAMVARMPTDMVVYVRTSDMMAAISCKLELYSKSDLPNVPELVFPNVPQCSRMLPPNVIFPNVLQLFFSVL